MSSDTMHSSSQTKRVENSQLNGSSTSKGGKIERLIKHNWLSASFFLTISKSSIFFSTLVWHFSTTLCKKCVCITANIKVLSFELFRHCWLHQDHTIKKWYIFKFWVKKCIMHLFFATRSYCRNHLWLFHLWDFKHFIRRFHCGLSSEAL